MGQLKRLAHYGIRLLLDRKYRNHVLDIVSRQALGVNHPTLDASVGVADDVSFLRGKRLFLAAGCDQTFMAEYLQKLGMDVCHTFASGRGSDPLTELMTPGSRALAEPWDYYLLSISQILRVLIRKMQVDGIGYKREDQQEHLNSILDNYRQAIPTIRAATGAPIFLFSYLLSYLPTYGLHEYRSMKAGWSLIEFWHIYHLRLYELAREWAGVYVLDADLALENAGKRLGIDAMNSNGIYDHPSRYGAKSIGDHLVQHLSILEPKRRRVKCAVFDLDGTLWSGVLREDGAAGVAVREYYLNVMEKLAARGILLAVCSKNDPVELGLLPGLLGEELYAKILIRKLSWLPKSQMLREIAEELNIGLDSLAFFDDSSFERAEVSANSPQVLVLLPEQILGCMNLHEFQQLGEITQESVARTEKYQQQAKRKQAEQASAGKLLDFLVSCNFKLDLRAPAEGELSRIFELLQRTNQLNATMVRTSMEQLMSRFRHPKRYVMRTARLQDRFGDYGLIGFATADRDNGSWQIVDFAFSCRSAGRGVEQAMLSHLAAVARAENATKLCIHFVQGPRNQQMFEILKESGFAHQDSIASIEGVGIRLDRSLGGTAQAAFPDWLCVSAPHEGITESMFLHQTAACIRPVPLAEEAVLAH